MNLENRIIELHNTEQKYVKDEKIVKLLKAVLVDNITDVYDIMKYANMTLKTIIKYSDDKELMARFLNESEYEMFKNKIDIILEKKDLDKKNEDLKLLGRIIDDIFNTRYRLEQICSNNYFPRNKFKDMLMDEDYISKNFGEGILAKIKDKISENSMIREKTPRNMILLESRWDIFVANPNIHYLNELDYRKLSFASDYLCSGANIDYVVSEHNTEVGSVLAILSDLKLGEILKPEHYKNLKRYVEIEKNLLNSNLLEKKYLLISVVEVLYKNNFDLEVALAYFNLPKYLFEKLLKEILVLPYFEDSIKQNINQLIDKKEEKKVK